MQLTMLASAVALAASTGQIADAPDRLISTHGVEIVSDGRVFVLFAALNGLGYSDETQRKGPPLRAPLFHPIRTQTRDAMRKLAGAGKLDAIRKLFDSKPAEIDTYLGAILAHDLELKSLSAKANSDAAALVKSLDAFKKLGNDEGLTQIFDAISVEQRKHAKLLMAKVDSRLAGAVKTLGVDKLKAPARLVVVPNPLDAHGSVRLVSTDQRDYLIVGPGQEEAERAILQATLRPLVRTWVDGNYNSAKNLKRHWDGLKISKRITERFPDGQSYLTENLTRVLAYRLRGGKDDEDFIDRQNKDGLRWARALLGAVDGLRGKPVSGSIARLLSRANP